MTRRPANRPFRTCVGAALFAVAGLLAAAGLTLPGGADPAQAQERTQAQAAQGAPAAVFNAQERAAIGAIVRDYLIANPEVLMEVLDALDARESAADEARIAAAIEANRAALERDGHSYVAGNPDADITVVEFFDYRCPACKMASDDVRRMIETRDDVRVVFKEFPILGPDSTLASRAAIAAIPMGGYLEFHFAMLANEGPLDRARILEIAREVGLDSARLERAMDSAKVAEIIDANYALAREIGVTGTPAFIIGNKLIPGAAPLEEIERVIAAERARRAEAG